ncbi:ethanolamine permease [Clostridium butyricum]|uniref:Ethanolamine permease n=1 Tax=Clostridium butyricum TaxID=1492 RepID=A0AAP9RJV2_CLOBU|nr:ethanolamine permease [Clostridium butyricum]MBZ5748273.1 ethanolamine permease [Clostridium butyricum]QMW93276.1 ethanolamine permease [Clostridium butyricum]BBK78712.1 ethanolamine permease [Clostridium butyricum]GEQ26866.1 ethanolamine permease [Clostridium butyricum]
MNNELKKTLKPIQLWSIIVGMVISGMYCGWNNALDFTSPVGFIIAILIVTVFYTTFMFSYAELSTAIPHAGGASEYASRALGKFGGFFAGFSCLVEFLFATPAIAISIGAYINFLVPAVPSVVAALVAYAIFVLINCFGIEAAAKVELIVTIIAIGGLLLFMGVGAPHIEMNNIFGGDIFKGGFNGVFGAIPFAIWFYLAVEGGAMSAEECENPKRDVPKGFILGIVTLVLLALGTFFVVVGISDLSTLSTSGSPLPDALKRVYGDGLISNGMSFIGLFGLVASLHGIIIGYSRQAFAMSRSGYLPKFLSNTNSKGAPAYSIVIMSLIGMVFVLTGQTAVIIVISCFGAVALYIISMISLFILRSKEPNLNRPFKVAYPVVPAVALLIAFIFLISLIVSNFSTVLWVVGAYVAAIIYYFVYSKIQGTDSQEITEGLKGETV